jgi:hypothetical protein
VAFFDIFKQDRPHAFSLDDIEIVDEPGVQRLRDKANALYAAFLLGGAAQANANLEEFDNLNLQR